MTQHQKEQLLNALMHYMPMEVRERIARELPEAYAAFNRVQRTVSQFELEQYIEVAI